MRGAEKPALRGPHAGYARLETLFAHGRVGEGLAALRPRGKPFHLRLHLIVEERSWRTEVSIVPLVALDKLVLHKTLIKLAMKSKENRNGLGPEDLQPEHIHSAN